jgi:hypothetical protein
MEDVLRGEQDEGAERRESAGVGDVDFRDREETGEDLIGEAVEAEVEDAEAEGDAWGEVPAGRGNLSLQGFNDGLGAHGDLTQKYLRVQR